MQITAALAADLALLSAALSDLSEDLMTDLADMVLLLAADARLAVRSFLGLTATVTIAVHADGSGDTVPLRFILLEDEAAPREVATSLLLPLPTEVQVSHRSRWSSTPRRREPSSTWPPTCPS